MNVADHIIPSPRSALQKPGGLRSRQCSRAPQPPDDCDQIRKALNHANEWLPKAFSPVWELSHTITWCLEPCPPAFLKGPLFFKEIKESKRQKQRSALTHCARAVSRHAGPGAVPGHTAHPPHRRPRSLANVTGTSSSSLALCRTTAIMSPFVLDKNVP
jgi:hypothetical protein